MKRAKALSRYRERISAAATAEVSRPIRSGRIDLEVWFRSPGVSRADVDNILKPILDALKGIVYVDDRQVRSVKVVALPTNDAFKLVGTMSPEIMDRLLGAKPDPEFMIDVYEGLWLEAPGI
jgi:Holliday junction resolvase RusA-like endonuclease